MYSVCQVFCGPQLLIKLSPGMGGLGEQDCLSISVRIHNIETLRAVLIPPERNPQLYPHSSVSMFDMCPPSPLVSYPVLYEIVLT